MSLPTQSSMETAGEVAAVMLCAAAGGLAVSLHFGFLSLFAVGFYVNRKCTEKVRKREQAVTEIEELVQQIYKKKN